MSDDDFGPYGVLQNPDAAAVTANALVGERAGNVTAHQADAAYGPARFSTAPYNPPRPAVTEPQAEPAATATGPTCRYKNCRQPRQEGFLYCDRHVEGGGD